MIGSLARCCYFGQRSRSGLRFCSGQGKPPKGFEGFFKGRSAKEAAKPAEAAKENGASKRGPKETPENPKAEEVSKEKQGGPKEHTAKEEAGKDRAEMEGKEGPEKGKDNKESPEAQRIRMMVLAAGGALAFGLSYFLAGEAESTGQEVTMQEMLREYLMKGKVEKIQIVNQGLARVYLRKDTAGPEVVTINLGRPEAFETKLENAQNELGIAPLEHIPIQYVYETNYLGEILPYVPSLLFLLPLLWVSRSLGSGLPGAGGPGGRNVFSMGKAFPSQKKDVKSKVRFGDVAGLEQAKAEVVEFVDFLKSPTKYEKLGARVPKGGLFVGPPGTGKTLLAKAVAGEADCPFYSMSGSDFVEMYVGVGASRVRDLFKQARDSAPSIIFIDEIDAIGRKRGKGGFTGGNDERESTLNQMLVEMDGFTSSTGVVVLAGTNRVDILDNALLRPGRFDRQIAIDKPDMAEREKIYMVHLKPVKLEGNLKQEDIAKRMAALTPGFAGADIANVCNEAAIFAARRKGDSVTMDDFERATERVIGGLPKTNSLMSAEDKRTVAIHESGHAVAGWFLEHADPLLKVSIQPRSSGALGFAQYLPAEFSLYSKEAILDKIAVSLGGRAAEELFVGKISTGASDDLDKVTKMAHAMVAIYGMSDKIGLLNFGQNDASSQFYKPYSEATGQMIDKETREVVDQQYERVKKLLLEHQAKLMELTKRLDAKETLVYNELVEVLGERPYEMKKEISGFVTAGANPFATEEATEEKTDEGPPSGGDGPATPVLQPA
ncbi:FTSH10 [Symbiodinium pilosum]|uniref:FTSH10 protein n=1 Tax=Symbiodinium pilosum TaxID=2952 RepID=A0A812YGV6_SYMPI|nr:FTSH10 [Symbiodinium pilosum]